MKYMLITAYNDLSCKTEIADLPALLNAVAIYYSDPDFFTAHIIDCVNKEEVAVFTKGYGF